MGGNSTHIPLKVNTAGVIPVIFAQSLMQTPVFIAALLGYTGAPASARRFSGDCPSPTGFDPNNWIYTIGAAVYLLLITAFAYF